MALAGQYKITTDSVTYADGCTKLKVTFYDSDGNNASAEQDYYVDSSSDQDVYAALDAAADGYHQLQQGNGDAPTLDEDEMIASGSKITSEE